MEEYYLMWLSRIDGIGFKRANYLLEHFGSAEAIWHAESETIKRIPAIPEKITNLLLASRKEELLKQMMTISYKSDVSLVILMLTDVLLEGSYLLFVGDDDIISQAFDVSPKDNEVFLPEVMSRKKQVIPSLSALWG